MTKFPSCKHLDPRCVQFTVFQPNEIRKLSVAKISIPLSFNALGHPLKGGLYDPALGPVNEKSDPCSTCSSNVFNCPGHLGHIELPLLIFNPLFYDIVFSILKISCLSCSNMRIVPEAKYLLIAQLTLLDGGYATEAQECENVINKYLTEESSLSHEGRASLIKEELDNYVRSVIYGQVKPIKDTVQQSKNIESLKNSYTHGTFSKTVNNNCAHCGSKVRKITLVQNKLMTNVIAPDEDKQSKPKTVATNILPEQARNYLRDIWKQEQDLITALAPVLKNSSTDFPTDIFFLDIIPVPPPKSRPVNILDGKMLEHPQTIIYRYILEDCLVARNIIKFMQDNSTSNLSEEGRLVVKHAKGNTGTEKLYHAWEELQRHVDLLIDADTAGGYGLKQIIEKKDGVIRMHMMGKRVNFAARSVITPDPNLNIDEIGIPEVFAKTLTYPVPVTPWNVSLLRKMVVNGPNVHPGAVTVQNEDGSINKLSSTSQVQREGIAKRLLTPEGSSVYPRRTKVVHRHLQNGDILLLNRQPTLHRPSIMAHKARVLKGEKTLRLHYANCKAYNADFDGDEMNAHFPQNELARSEAYNLVSVPNQYLVPKDGTPLCGLIQDHMVSGVRLSVRGRFFTKEDYFGLVFHALPHLHGKVKLLRPAIIKPLTLWSGKQVISTVIINTIPKGKNRITLHSTSKIPGKAWELSPRRPWVAGGTPFSYNLDMSEADVIIHKGELLCGVLDKTHYGATPYGLIHCIYELYGGSCAISLLSAFAKLFTAFLQFEGFTLGVEDILVVRKADRKRSHIIKQARKIGPQAVAAALDLESPSEEELESKLSQVYGEDYEKWRTVIDRSYKKFLDSCTNDINHVCLPAGLLQKFPANNLQLMVQSGAKGSTVNTMQISCLLGQIELEGKRPPLMLSGKSLPSFRRFDQSPRAGGFVDGRFMTGIQPQEFFFHCMAGREGLIDTAVKTSRSGYLQRCLVKHLEGLVVNYDGTVRDSDGSVIQFSYGEDGMDVMKVQFLKAQQIPFLVENCSAVIDKKALKILKNFDEDDINNLKLIEKKKKKIKKWKKKWNSTVNQKRTSKTWRRCPDPVTATFRPDQQFGALTERLDSLMNDYLTNRFSHSISESNVQDMIYFKSMVSSCSPGEPVGLLASQSVGEPSTQMTLNTFHFAGRGEMNVTLGIPRLREILMLASKNIKTPSMDVPFLPDLSSVEKKAENLKKRLRRTVLSDVLEYITVEDRLSIGLDGIRERRYTIKLQFLPHKAYKLQFIVKPHNILMYVENYFISNLLVAIKKLIKFKDDILATENFSEGNSKHLNEDDADDPVGNDKQASMARKLDIGESHMSSDEEPEAEDDDATQARLKSRHQENQEYEEPEEEEADDVKLEDENCEVNEEAPEENNIVTELRENLSERCKKVVASHSYLVDYKYDSEHELWCEITLAFPLSAKRLDLSTLLKTEAERAVVWETPAIKKAFTYVSPDTGALMLKTDGINFSEMFKYRDLLDLNKLYSNDIYGISLTYGIEAARMVIVKEVKDVFKMYGITVDPRHLLLIADYMTFEGTFEPLSRKGMEDSTSPLQQISFESSLKFLKTATLQGKRDHLCSPSSRIMIGRPCKNGTGLFSVLQKLIFSSRMFSE
ncbi:DNA-directed RNA polymerase I subunit RPA1 [Anabrus simplex]|uniref:DNA-directed RNA polymerase I subunit RPA1 n=1 Tax=Anabrus simplex TaxID=316456 RepID=UPI0034DD1812